MRWLEQAIMRVAGAISSIPLLIWAIALVSASSEL